MAAASNHIVTPQIVTQAIEMPYIGLRTPTSTDLVEGENLDIRFRLRELEIMLIRTALIQAKGNRTRAAKLLGMGRPTLINRIRKYKSDLGGADEEPAHS